ncbi:nucleoside deaminase [Limibacter armeniacum]|uniref:nucleoside deaminase n=1 Tax=Limibacter armeniacum TaxID=466084 RepID=UPI002FE556AB
MKKDHINFIQRAIELSMHGLKNNLGYPFGSVIVKDDKIVGEGCNHVTSKNDPTAHAEIVAIRNACQQLSTFDLTGCVIYTSCEPCPMCLGAIYWAGIQTVYYANTQNDAEAIGFDDAEIYRELEKPMEKRKIDFIQLERDQAQKVFKVWKEQA